MTEEIDHTINALVDLSRDFEPEKGREFVRYLMAMTLEELIAEKYRIERPDIDAPPLALDGTCPICNAGLQGQAQRN
ncbi:MAG: hypothetical protein AAGG72_07395 [Pseudomonadota bacterium]